MERFLEKIWYGRHPAAALLAPLGLAFRAVVNIRRVAYRSGLLPSLRPEIPVVVVGNLTVGGTGKTPLVIWIVHYLRAQGFKPGVVSRGYRGNARSWPQQVRPDSDPAMVGDEAIVIARRTGCPIAVGPNRAECVEALMQYADCNVIVSDDGLQHYRLQRDVEILVVDAVRRFGNGRCLPAGPLRESISRVKEVDLTVSNGIASRGEFEMKTTASQLLPVNEGAGGPLALDVFTGKQVNAVAGIGHPERFFDMLRIKGIRANKHIFPDHHSFMAKDFAFDSALPIVMTEKDAVKCERLQLTDAWYLPLEVTMPDVFGHRLMSCLGATINGC